MLFRESRIWHDCMARRSKIYNKRYVRRTGARWAIWPNDTLVAIGHQGNSTGNMESFWIVVADVNHLNIQIALQTLVFNSLGCFPWLNVMTVQLTEWRKSDVDPKNRSSLVDVSNGLRDIKCICDHCLKWSKRWMDWSMPMWEVAFVGISDMSRDFLLTLEPSLSKSW